MMFGGPSHQLSAQTQATARVLDIQTSCMMFLIPCGTSNVKFIRQGSALDLGKLSYGYATSRYSTAQCPE